MLPPRALHSTVYCGLCVSYHWKGWIIVIYTHWGLSLTIAPGGMSYGIADPEARVRSEGARTWSYRSGGGSQTTAQCATQFEILWNEANIQMRGSYLYSFAADVAYPCLWDVFAAREFLISAIVRDRPSENNDNIASVVICRMWRRGRRFKRNIISMLLDNLPPEFWCVPRVPDLPWSSGKRVK